MDQEIKTKWLEALRSRKYDQCKDALHTKDGFCCLGVLLDTVEPNEWDSFEEGWRHPSDDGDEFLSADFRENVGLQKEVQVELAAQNDGGQTFQEIAQWIEEFL